MTGLLSELATVSAAMADVYRDLHRHPELSFAEHRTSRMIIEHLSALGIETLTGLGGTGVVGVVRNGAGQTVMLRADMDALPVLEETGLDYASAARGNDPDGGDVPIMHACGHDMHVACLLGATRILVGNTNAWSGTLVVVFQPGEELGRGAAAMIDDGLFDRVPVPAVVLGQHVAPAPVGMLGAHPGPAFAGSDGLAVRLFGRGGHGSRPETTVDPVVMAAATVMRLQTVASREVAAAENLLEPGAVTGSEDVSFLATASGAPLVFWLLGGTDAAEIASAASRGTMERDIPSNHSSRFAPVIHPTLDRGIAALIVAAMQWLGEDAGVAPTE
jgi:amidohydrolase